MIQSEFVGKNVFITGAASGIGYAQASAFLEQGASVYGFDIDPIGLDKLVNAYPTNFQYSVGV